MVKLQVLIAAFGRKGIQSVAQLSHPEMPGVEYIVSWQYGDDEPIVPDSLLCRKDFRVMPTATRGVARNRNLALAAASAPVVLESDDDVSYTSSQLQNVIDAFDLHPEADFISFKYYSKDNPRIYPDYEFDFRSRPKGYYVGGIEMAFRLEPIRRAGIIFNELFGIGAEFPSGEEDVFVIDMLNAGLKAIFLPITIVTHDSDSTGMREDRKPNFIRTKGAIGLLDRPKLWPLRMIAHAFREAPSKKPADIWNYCRWWLQGVRNLRRLSSVQSHPAHS